MSKKVKIWISRQAVRECILTSPEMSSILSGLAGGVAGRAGAGYEMTVKTGRNRAYASVEAATPAAERDNRENNTLLRCLR